MDQIRTLQLNAIETDGKIQVSLFQGISSEDGAECSRRKLIELPADPAVCCQDCWEDMILAEVSEVGESVAWTYFHSEACGDDHKETADA